MWPCGRKGNICQQSKPRKSILALIAHQRSVESLACRPRRSAGLRHHALPAVMIFQRPPATRCWRHLQALPTWHSAPACRPSPPSGGSKSGRSRPAGSDTLLPVSSSLVNPATNPATLAAVAPKLQPAIGSGALASVLSQLSLTSTSLTLSPDNNAPAAALPSPWPISPPLSVEALTAAAASVPLSASRSGKGGA